MAELGITPENIGTIGMIVSIVIFWQRMATANKAIIESLKAITERMEKTRDFQKGVERDLVEFKKSMEDQKVMAGSHADHLSETNSEIRSQREGQKYMTRLFEDLKDLTRQTNDTMTKIGGVMDHLTIMIDTRGEK